MGDDAMTVGDALEISDILKDASPSSRAEIMSFAYIKGYEKGQHVFTIVRSCPVSILY